MSKRELARDKRADASSVPVHVVERASDVVRGAQDRPNQQVTLIALVGMALAAFALWVVYALASG